MELVAIEIILAETTNREVVFELLHKEMSILTSSDWQ